jgi:small-conductance mechanosensitive channel
MSSQHNAPKRSRSFQFSVAALFVCMTVAAVFIAWGLLAIRVSAVLAGATAAGIWLGLHSPNAVVVSGVLVAAMFWVVSRLHRNDKRSDCQDA